MWIILFAWAKDLITNAVSQIELPSSELSGPNAEYEPSGCLYINSRWYPVSHTSNVKPIPNRKSSSTRDQPRTFLHISDRFCSQLWVFDTSRVQVADHMDVRNKENHILLATSHRQANEIV